MIAIFTIGRECRPSANPVATCDRGAPRASRAVACAGCRSHWRIDRRGCRKMIYRELKSWVPERRRTVLAHVGLASAPALDASIGSPRHRLEQPDRRIDVPDEERSTGSNPAADDRAVQRAARRRHRPADPDQAGALEREGSEFHRLARAVRQGERGRRGLRRPDRRAGGPARRNGGRDGALRRQALDARGVPREDGDRAPARRRPLLRACGVRQGHPQCRRYERSGRRRRHQRHLHRDLARRGQVALDGRSAPRPERIAGSAGRQGATNPGKNRGLKRTASGTGNGNPTTIALPCTWSWAVQSEVQRFAAGAISVASPPITCPIRPPVSTLHCDTPPQWLTVPGCSGFGMLFVQSFTIRAAACGLSRPTNLLETSLAKLVRWVTVTVPSGFAPAQTTGVPSGRMPEQGMLRPSRTRTLGLSK